MTTRIIIRAITSVLCLVMAMSVLADDSYAKARQGMVKLIEKDTRETSFFINKKALDPRVMSAMGTVPRHEFVSGDYRSLAYKNRPLPIGYGQTISQPFIVALMTDLIELDANAKVLEVGTGSGYQAAILGELAADVYTIEIVRPLGENASELLKRLQYNNVEVRVGDGYYGWEEQAPFDAIVVTAVASHVPPPLVQQLKPGGRMVIPVGSRFLVQQLVVVEKDAKGKVTTKQLLPVRFVPLTGGH
jgi:protein-L-isoaspartate(D-aspartate) O-methyltransferase